jgi:hypothetical protein
MHEWIAGIVAVLGLMVTYNLVAMVLEHLDEILGRQTRTISNTVGQLTAQYMIRVIIIALCITISYLLW